MKKKNILFIILIMTIIIAPLSIAYHSRNRRTYELNIPQLEEVTQIILKQDTNSIIINDIKQVDKIINTLNGVKRITKKESIQDSPINIENEIRINIYSKEYKYSTIYIYKRKSKYYIEQPYNGIYKITSDEYNSIEKYIR